MIKEGSTVILETAEANYCPCKVVNLSSSNITISYCAGTAKDKETGKIIPDVKIETIPRKNITRMSERIP